MIRLLAKISPHVLALPRVAKRLVALSLDASLCALTVWVAFYLRLGDIVSITASSWSADVAVVISICLALPIFIVSGLYRAIFRYSGWPAMQAVLRATLSYGILYSVVITFLGIQGIPRTIGLIQPLLLFFAIGASRAFIRLWLGENYQKLLRREAIPRAFIYGAGVAGRELATALTNNMELRVVGFLDDDERLHGHSLNGLVVYSPDTLEDLISRLGVAHVLLAIPSLSRYRRNQIISSLNRYRVAVRTLPSFSDWVGGRIGIDDLKELDVEDLLGRDPVPPNQILLNKNIRDKIVMVTGAGGSIGSELVRTIIDFEPDTLLLFDISEFGLYAINAEVEALIRGKHGCHIKHVIPLLGSVRDEHRVEEVLKKWHPDTIYHAAAYKHVPLVEHNVREGLLNNVFGTLCIAESAIQTKVSDFVLVSTDKAVRPTNVMGASKRLAEMCLQALFFRDSMVKQSLTRFSIVRFGNVLDSSGSVIPKFRKQIRDGGPLTVTHPEVTRFFMTKVEAAQLVIQAGAMSEGGDVFVLDMGNPVKIFDLARQMIELSGLSVKDADRLDGDIEIEVTGLRPGEKLFEELVLGDDLQKTQHPKIMRAMDPYLEWDELQISLRELKTHLENHRVELARKLMIDLVVGYQPSGPVVDWLSPTSLDKFPSRG